VKPLATYTKPRIEWVDSENRRKTFKIEKARTSIGKQTERKETGESKRRKEVREKKRRGRQIQRKTKTRERGGRQWEPERQRPKEARETYLTRSLSLSLSPRSLIDQRTPSERQDGVAPARAPRLLCR
jgi:hypothetical protein